jgi:hypothetical protein
LITSNEKIEISQYFFDLSLYRNDISFDALSKELDVWLVYKKKNNLENINDVRKEFSSKNLKVPFPNLFTLLSIYLTVPISSSECERSFSVLKRLKTWLRSTMGQDRLSNLALIQINSDYLSKLDIGKIIDIFATKTNRKIDFF